MPKNELFTSRKLIASKNGLKVMYLDRHILTVFVKLGNLGLLSCHQENGEASLGTNGISYDVLAIFGEGPFCCLSVVKGVSTESSLSCVFFELGFLLFVLLPYIV